MLCENDAWVCVRWKATAEPKKPGQANLECVCDCIWCSRVILTASLRPDSVGVLSMRASNTSSTPVLTYKRTKYRERKERKDLDVKSSLTHHRWLSSSDFLFSIYLSAGLLCGLACWVESCSGLCLDTTSSGNSWQHKTNIQVRQRQPLCACIKLTYAMGSGSHDLVFTLYAYLSISSTGAA